MVALPKSDNRVVDTIIQGDCLEVLQGLQTASVDSIIIDPPYFLPAAHYQSRAKWARSLSDLSIIEHFIGSVLAECRRVLKPEGALLVFCDGQSYPVMYVRAYRVFERLTEIIWDKAHIGLGVGIRHQHEIILVAFPCGFQWQQWTSSIIRCPVVPSQKRIHPAEKPIELLRQLCRLVTPAHGIMLDCFAGSGATCLAAQLEDLHYIGVERESEYADIARERLAHRGLWEVRL